MADGIVAGRLEIPVEADTSTFEDRLKAKVEGIANRIEAKVKAVFDTRQLRADLEAAVQEAADGLEATIKASFDTDDLRANLVTAVEEAQAGVEAHVSAVLDADQLRAELEAKAEAATAGFQLKLQAKVEGLAGEVVKAEAEAQAAADTNPVDVPVKLDEKGLRGKLLTLIAELRAEAAAAPDVTVKTKVDDKPLKGLLKLLRPGLYVGIASLIQPLIALLGQAAAGAGALVSALSPAVGLIGALPGGIATLVSILGTAVVGFGGFTKAIQNYAKAQGALKKAQKDLAASQASVTKSMKGLTPAQQDAVKNYSKLKDTQKAYRAELAKLDPQERAAVNNVKRTNSAYNTTARQLGNLSDRLSKLTPEQKKAVDQALALTGAQQKNSAALKSLTPQQQQLVKDMRGLSTQQKAVVKAQEAVNDALKDLSPSAKTAALAIYGLDGAWKKTKKSVQESIFSGFAKDIEPAATRTLPLLQTQLGKVGKQIGLVVDKTLKFVQTPLFRAQFRAVTDQAAHSVGILGTAGLGLATAFGNVAVASIPLQNRMLGVIARFSDWAATATTGVEAGSKMRAFFKDAGDTAGQLARILKDVGDAVFKIFSAGRGAGNTLLDGVEKQAHRLSDYMNSPKGFAAVKDYFDKAVPGARALASLAGAIGRALGQLSKDNNLASMLDEIRTQLVPALTEVLDQFGRNLGPQIITAISEIIRLLGNLSSAASPLSLLATAIADIAAGINAVLDAVPGLGPAIGTLLGFAAVAKVMGLLGGATKVAAVQLLNMRKVFVGGAFTRAAGFIQPLVTGMQTLAGGVVASLTRSLVDLGAAEKGAAIAAKGLLGAITVVGVALAANQVSKWMADAEVPKQKIKDLSAALTELGTKGDLGKSGLDLFSKGLGPLQKSASGTSEALNQFAVNAYNALSDDLGAKIHRWQDFGEDAGQFKEQVTELDAALAAMAQGGHQKEATAAFQKLADAATANGVPIDKLKAAFPQYTNAVDGATVATQKQKKAADDAKAALATLGGQLDHNATAANTMKTALDGVLGLFQSVPQAEASLADVIANATGKIDKQTKAWIKNHGALNINTKSGRDLLGTITGMISANANVANAVLQTTGSQKKANDAWNAGRRKILDHLTAMGLSKTEAEKLVNKYGGLKDAITNVPKLLKLRVKTDGLAAASEALSNVRTLVRKINGSVVRIRVEEEGGLNTATFTSTDKHGHTETRLARAFGGFVRGKGGPTDDANTVKLSSGEFVVRAARSKRFAALLQAINSGSERTIQAAVNTLSSAGSAVHGIAAHAAAAALPPISGSAGGRSAVRGLRPSTSPLVVVQPPAPTAAGSAGKTTIVDADGALIGTMRTAATRTARSARRAERLGGLGTWGAAPAWG